MGGWGWLLCVRCPFSCRAWYCFCGPALQGHIAEHSASSPVGRSTSSLVVGGLLSRTQDGIWANRLVGTGHRTGDGVSGIVGRNVLTFSGGGRGQTREPKLAWPAQLGAAGRPGWASSARRRLVAGPCCGAARRSTATAAVPGVPGPWLGPGTRRLGPGVRTGGEQARPPACPPRMSSGPR